MIGMDYFIEIKDINSNNPSRQTVIIIIIIINFFLIFSN
jgi:hypothetical protein